MCHFQAHLLQETACADVLSLQIRLCLCFMYREPEMYFFTTKSFPASSQVDLFRQTAGYTHYCGQSLQHCAVSQNLVHVSTDDSFICIDGLGSGCLCLKVIVIWPPCFRSGIVRHTSGGTVYWIDCVYALIIAAATVWSSTSYCYDHSVHYQCQFQWLVPFSRLCVESVFTLTQ